MFDIDEEKKVPAERFYIASLIAIFTTISTLLLGFSYTKHIKEETDAIINDEGYTICYANNKGYIIKTKELIGYSMTKSRNVLLRDEDYYCDVYNVDELLIIGEYPDRETAEEVLEIINHYNVTTEVPTLEEPSGEIKK